LENGTFGLSLLWDYAWRRMDETDVALTHLFDDPFRLAMRRDHPLAEVVVRDAAFPVDRAGSPAVARNRRDRPARVHLPDPLVEGIAEVKVPLPVLAAVEGLVQLGLRGGAAVAAIAVSVGPRHRRAATVGPNPQDSTIPIGNVHTPIGPHGDPVSEGVLGDGGDEAVSADPADAAIAIIRDIQAAVRLIFPPKLGAVFLAIFLRIH
jgi:hypothetical protein